MTFTRHGILILLEIEIGPWPLGNDELTARNCSFVVALPTLAYSVYTSRLKYAGVLSAGTENRDGKMDEHLQYGVPCAHLLSHTRLGSLLLWTP